MADDGGPRQMTEAEWNAYRQGMRDMLLAAGKDPERRTLRDQFANAALVALLNNPKFEWDLAPSYTPEENLARRCFAIADAMIRERLKSPDPSNPLWEPEHKE